MIDRPEIVIPLLAGFLLDCFIGDPHWLPHPIRLYGKAISLGEIRLNSGKSKRFKGAVLTITLISSTFFFFWALLKLVIPGSHLFIFLATVFVFYGLANRSLIQESWKVIQVLNKDGIGAGRKQLSWIVGRDTSRLNENKIRIAVLETLAENLSDGVIAPLFYYALGGVPAIMAYKMANTLDSMIAYKNERYEDFGFFAAKLDDVLNFVPARLTALIMVTITFSIRGTRYILKYGKKHSSPNAGYPEAALAGILNCRFGGPNVYHGVMVDKPFIGSNGRDVSNSDVMKACLINFLSSVLSIVLIILLFRFI